MAQFIRLRKIKRKPMRLGSTAISNAASGTLVSLDDVNVKRDLQNFDWNNVEIISTSVDETHGGAIGGGVVTNIVPALVSADVASPLTGQIRWTPVALQAGDVATSVIFQAGATPGATLTHSWAVLASSDGTNYTVQAVSPDNTGASWTAKTTRTFTFGTPYVVPTTANYFVGLMVAGTTMPTLYGVNVVDATVFTTILGAGVNGLDSTAGRTTPLALAATVAVANTTNDVKVPFVKVA